jgi:asparagine synthase (glutamine-hydrolysing)
MYGRSIFRDVRELLPGRAVEWRDGQRLETRFWNPADFGPDNKLTEADAADRFRSLFFEAVQLRLTGESAVWAQLSGGLDSSSVVTVAESLFESGEAPCGIAGTVTYVDTLAAGDEREFSRHVVDRWSLRNEQVVDYWPWQDDDAGAPAHEDPHIFLPYYARDRRMSEIVSRSGGRVLLSGYGGDHYLTGGPHFIADLFADGNIVAALREAAAWSIASRRSFWKQVYRTGIYPNLPPRLRFALSHRRPPLPAWLTPKFTQRYELWRRTAAVTMLAAPIGHKFDGEAQHMLATAHCTMTRSIFDDHVDVRYPFFYRPLVEFCLRLPPRLRARPGWSKWILREAMKNLLPEPIRLRTGKGTVGARVRWALTKERHLVRALLTDSILEQLGCINSKEARRAVRSVRNGRGTSAGLLTLLSLEMWLRMRAGGWGVVARQSMPRDELFITT